MAYKIGLKLWSTNDFYINDAKRLYKEGFYQYIELYTIPNSFNKYAKIWKKLNIPYVIHAPHFKNGMNLAKKENFDLNMKLSKEALFFADKLGAESIIFHPGIGGNIKETAVQIKKIGDERIIVENKPCKAIGYDLNCNGYNFEEIEYIINNCNVGFCLDIGHAVCSANAQKIDPFEYVSKFLELKPKMFHLSDGDINGVIDKHLHFGDGTFDINKFIYMVPNNSRITLETPKNHISNLSDFEMDCLYVNLNFDYTIQLAKEDDMLDIYNLSNDVEVRNNSYNSAFIDLEQHKTWFNNKINNNSCVYYVVRNKNGELLGQVRFDKIIGNDYVVGISLSSKERGRGVGSKLLKHATYLFLRQSKGGKIVANIKYTNKSSLKAFLNAGYKITSDNSEVCGVRTYNLIYE